MNKKLLLTILGVMVLAPMVIVPILKMFGYGEVEKKENKTAVEQQADVKPIAFDAPFNAVYMVSQAADLDNYYTYYLRLSDRGVAELEHRHKQCFNYYTYEIHGDEILLKGECRFVPNRYNRKKLSQEKPEDLVLKVVKDDSKVVFEALTKDGKIAHRMIEPFETVYSYFNPVYYNGYQALMKKDPLHLWVAKDDGGAYEDQGEEMVMRQSFKKGDILMLNEEKSTDKQLVMEFPGDRTYYVDRRDVLYLGTTQRVLSVLYMEAECLENVLRMDERIGQWAHHEEVKGYFNGWKAGKKSVFVFPVLIVLMAVLLLGSWMELESAILNQIVGTFVTVFMLWYFATLGNDSFWTFEQLTLKDGVISWMVAAIYVVVLSIFLVHTTDHLREINEVEDEVSPWIEYALLIPAVWIGTYVFITDWPMMLKLPAFYLALVVGSLPSAILYGRHSTKRVPMVWYMCFVKPMSYLALLAIAIAMVVMYIIGMGAKGQGGRSSEPEKNNAADDDNYYSNGGPKFQLHENGDGSYYDMFGNRYTRDGDSMRDEDGDKYNKA